MELPPATLNGRSAKVPHQYRWSPSTYVKLMIYLDGLVFMDLHKNLLKPLPLNACRYQFEGVLRACSVTESSRPSEFLAEEVADCE